MSVGSTNKRLRHSSKATNILCYADQGSFVGLRALGRGPALHLTWLYPHALNEVSVEKFNERLAQGLLGRLLQRSPLPWGRHRWVTNPLPTPVTWFPDPIPIEQLPEWRNSLVNLPLDPEYGPGWRLVVQPFEDGGCALSIIVSHTIADAQATIQAIADAVADRRLDLDYPTSSWRWSPVMLVRDSLQSLHALPDIWRALASVARLARMRSATPISHSPSHPNSSTRNARELAIDVPLIHIMIEGQVCDERASELGVRSNTLLAAIAARIALRLGRVDAAGRVKLVLPVSDRQPNDRRGNALSSITVMVDPDTCRGNPQILQRELKTALTSLLQRGDDVSTLFPLIPFVPLWVARRLERLALGTDLPVGCSLLGELPPELKDNSCGQASLILFSGLERFTDAALERLGGRLFLLCYRMGGRVLITVSGYAPNRVTTRAQLAPFVRDALDDLGLEGNVS